MALTNLRHKSRDHFFVAPEVNARAMSQSIIDSPHLLGTVSGTTISSASASIASHAAKVCRVTAPDSVRGQARLTTFGVAATSATLHAAFSTAGATQWEFWTLPCLIRCTTATSTTEIRCAKASNPGISEADDTYNGLYLLDMTDHDLVLISDYAQSTGTFTHAALGESPVVGEGFMVVQPLFSPWVITAEQAAIPRPAASGNLTHRESAQGVKRGTATGVVECRGLATVAGDGVAASPDYEIGTILRSQMTQTLDTGELVSGSASDDDEIDITTGTTAQFSDGALVLCNGAVSRIMSRTAGAPATLNVLPTTARGGMGNYPASGDIVYAMACWHRNVTPDDMYTMSLIHWMGSETFRLLQGCAWNAVLVFEQGAVPRFEFSFTGAALIEYDITESLSPTFSTKVARGNTPLTMLVGTTELTHVLGARVDFGFAPQRLDAVSAYDGTSEVIVTKGTPTVTWRQWMINATGIEDVQRAKVASVLIQSGKNAGNVVATELHRVEYTGAVVSEENGGYVVEYTGIVLDSQVSGISDLVYGQG